MSTERTLKEVGEVACQSSTASVEWKIKDYFSLPQEIDYCLQSSVFHFLDAIWCLWLYPNGQRAYQTAGCVSLYLVKMSSKSRFHRVQFTLGMVGPDGPYFKHKRLEYTFDGNVRSYGFRGYLEASALKQWSKEIAPMGVLTVFCRLGANTSDVSDTDSQTDTSLGVEKLVRDFKNLLFSGEATDMTLAVKDRKYKVHSAVLVARSSVFAAMMRHDMKEKISGVVQIDDCDPEAFQQFLTYLYSGDFGNFSADTVFSLHNIADKYDTQQLKTSCIQFMRNNLSVEIFCDVLSLSLSHNESELLEEAIVYFAKNLMDILVTPKWLSFVKENPAESNELYIKAAKYNAKQNASP